MPYIVTVSGASGSGKTTFSLALRDYCERNGISAALLSADRCFLNPLPEMISPADGRIYPDFNSPASVDMKGLLGDAVRLRDSGEHDLIIIEGVTVLCDESIRAVSDVKVFIDASIEMRIYRRIKRNTEEKGQSIEFIGGYYLRCARYREKEFALPSARYADLRIDNEWGFDIEKEGKEILSRIKG